MEIVASARRHGNTDAAIRDALENPIFVHYLDGYQMVIGAAADGQLLEVAINERGQVFHAMPARPKYYRTR